MGPWTEAGVHRMCCYLVLESFMALTSCSCVDTGDLMEHSWGPCSPWIATCGGSLGSYSYWCCCIMRFARWQLNSWLPANNAICRDCWCHVIHNFWSARVTTVCDGILIADSLYIAHDSMVLFGVNELHNSAILVQFQWGASTSLQKYESEKRINAG